LTGYPFTAIDTHDCNARPSRESPPLLVQQIFQPYWRTGNHGTNWSGRHYWSVHGWGRLCSRWCTFCGNACRQHANYRQCGNAFAADAQHAIFVNS
jgi:hypothetical protein